MYDLSIDTINGFSVKVKSGRIDPSADSLCPHVITINTYIQNSCVGSVVKCEMPIYPVCTILNLIFRFGSVKFTTWGSTFAGYDPFLKFSLLREVIFMQPDLSCSEVALPDAAVICDNS